MTDTSNEIILHNYPQSPVAEKARIAFGIKGLSWRSVEIPRIVPKPMLTKLTGGYRRTPVMQIGADIYCDTQCIIRELERRHPAPTFFPTVDAGLMWCLSRWTDGPVFDLAVKVILGAAGDALPQDFAEDRGRLYLGPDWAEGLKAANADLPHLASQFRAPLSWANDQLSDNRNFLLGEDPAAIDAQLYHLVWFLRGRWDSGPAFLSEFAHLERWEENVGKIGHGTMTEMCTGIMYNFHNTQVQIPDNCKVGTEICRVDIDPRFDDHCVFGKFGEAYTNRFFDNFFMFSGKFVDAFNNGFHLLASSIVAQWQLRVIKHFFPG